MKSQLFKLPFKKHHNNICFISVMVLLLALAILAITNLCLSFTNQHISSPSSSSPRVLAKECNIFQGEWVPDPDAPYYTNNTCSVIHEHYDCMKYGKPDLGFMKWRWQPGGGCELPRFDPVRFLDMMRGKSMAFVGDSLARNHMHSLICLLTRVVAHPIPSANQDYTYATSYYSTYNFTISNFWAPYLVRYEQADPDGPAHTGLWNLYLDEPDAVWAPHIAEFDYIIISASSWFYRPSMLYEGGQLVGCHHCLAHNVTDLTLRYALRMASRAALRAVNGADGKFRGTAVLRTVSPSHYENGEWNKDGNCVTTRPYRGEERRMEGVELDFHTAQVEELVAAEVVAREAGVKMLLMDTTEAMILRADAHPSRYRQWTPEKYFTLYNDCVHWCLPGAIDVWNDMLLQMLLH